MSATVSAAAGERQVRISRIAGRYLVFDIDDVIFIRRYHGVCAVLTGTMPQNPTQNLFLGLPVELQAEEAKLLVDKGVAYIADELADHLARLSSPAFEPARKAYREHLKHLRRNAQQAFEEEKARVAALHKDKRAAGKKRSKKPAVEGGEANPKVVTEGSVATASAETSSAPEETTPSLFGGEHDVPVPPSSSAQPKKKEPVLPAVTPTTSSPLTTTPPLSLSSGNDKTCSSFAARSYPLLAHLSARGYYTTPGLRFGGAFSVYPGDPFRYHAHYLANSYGWEEKVPLLDVVTSGRLGTAVKKSFLFGAEKKPQGGEGEGEVRVFCVEWAGM
ncbi:hypothetical protein VTJ04DRAFT_4847 [Mycothermus thermophilus]|uniref:uncharacterized protein n=1 Tax=Humicola insolens TaxID=85995 RepID=UPI003743A8DC